MEKRFIIFGLTWLYMLQRWVFFSDFTETENQILGNLGCIHVPQFDLWVTSVWNEINMILSSYLPHGIWSGFELLTQYIPGLEPELGGVSVTKRVLVD